MGADGHVRVYDFDAVDLEHRRSHGRPIEEDWTYLARGLTELRGGERAFSRALVVRLRGEVYVLCYWNTECEGHNSDDEFWCASPEAHARVQQTLAKIGPLDECEVWT